MPDYKISFSASGETQKGSGRETNEDNFLIGGPMSRKSTN